MTLDAELKAIKENQDMNRSYEELKALRELVVFYLKRDLDLQEIDKTGTLPVAPLEPESGTSPQQSVLTRYFPLWGGWYGSSQEGQPEISHDSTKPSEEESSEANKSFSTLEEELLEGLADDAGIVPYKDVIFAQFSFTLKQGTLKLLSKRNELLFDMEFNDMKADWESRPRYISKCIQGHSFATVSLDFRTKSYKLGIALGAMNLRDKITQDSRFPFLISPHNVQGAPLNHKTSVGSMSQGRNYGDLGTSIRNLLQLPVCCQPVPLHFDTDLYHLCLSVLFAIRT